MKDKSGGDVILYWESGTKIIGLISEKLTSSFRTMIFVNNHAKTRERSVDKKPTLLNPWII